MELSEALDSRRGRTAEVARTLGVAAAYLSQMASGKRPVPAELVPALEKELGFEVRRWNLRPLDWHRIWPDLIGTPGAPATQHLQSPNAPGEDAGKGLSKLVGQGA